MSFETDWAAAKSMTETQWFMSESGSAMQMYLWHVAGQMNNRKRRLLECACCRQVWDQLPDPRSREAVEFAEQSADCEVAEIDLDAAATRAEEVWQAEKPDAFAGTEDVDEWRRLFFPLPLSAAAYNVTLPFGYWGGAPAFDAPSRIIREIVPSETVAQANLLRCIFGNPFRPVVFDPRWRTETAVALAAGIYDGRHFDRLPILADALEDAGCDAAELLTHLRGLGLHARGCWAVDAVLGRE